jgi:hypothetical protein
MLRLVPLKDLIEPLLDGDALPTRVAHRVSENQQV